VNPTQRGGFGRTGRWHHRERGKRAWLALLIMAMPPGACSGAAFYEGAVVGGLMFGGVAAMIVGIVIRDWEKLQ
jgi:hypothetical protein